MVPDRPSISAKKGFRRKAEIPLSYAMMSNRAYALTCAKFSAACAQLTVFHHASI
jgi:hypothetical protein